MLCDLSTHASRPLHWLLKLPRYLTYFAWAAKATDAYCASVPRATVMSTAALSTRILSSRAHIHPSHSTGIACCQLRRGRLHHSRDRAVPRRHQFVLMRPPMPNALRQSLRTGHERSHVCACRGQALKTTLATVAARPACPCVRPASLSAWLWPVLSWKTSVRLPSSAMIVQYAIR